MNSQIVTVNLVPGLSAPAVIRVSQYDVGRPLTIRVLDGTGAASFGSSVTANIVGTKPSGLGFTQSGLITGNTVTLNTTLAMTQESGMIPTEIRFTTSSPATVIGTANFILAVEPSPHPEGTTDGTQETMADLETRLQAEIDDLSDRIDDIEAGGSGLSNTEKQLILTLFSKAAYAEDDASTAYDTLENLWTTTTRTITYTLSHVTSSNTSASVENGSSYTTTLTAASNYTLNTVSVTMGGVDITSTAYSSGTITIPSVTGNIVITATAVLAAQSITATYTQSGTVYDTATLDSLKADLVVTANYSGGTSETVPASNYTLSGTLTEGTSTITVHYTTLTATFNVTVTKGVPSGYTKVDYLTSAVHGTPAKSHMPTTPYIKTGFPAADTDIAGYKVTLEFTPLFGEVNCCPFGGRNGLTAGATTLGTVLTYDVTNSNSNLNYGNQTGQSTALVTYLGNAFSVGTKCKFVLDAGKIYLDNTFVADTEAETAVQPSAYPWALFARDNAGEYTTNTTNGGYLSPFIGKIYGFSVQDGNGDYVVRYIPCYRNSDNVYGMYDVARNVFHISAISTAFSGGND